MSSDFIFRLFVVLERIHLHVSDILWFLLLTTHADSKHVFLERIPHDACDHL